MMKLMCAYTATIIWAETSYSFNLNSPLRSTPRSQQTPSTQLLHELNDDSRRTFVASIATLFTALILPKSSNAISPQEAASRYDIYAKTYDNLDGGSAASALGLDEARIKLLQSARGSVLEIGVGTGLNLSSYKIRNGGEDGITSLTLVDISEGMLSQARSRVKQLGLDKSIPVNFMQADATSQLVGLFGGNKFDTVVDTFSLCVMGNEGAEKCLKEMAAVAKDGKDGGQILLIENTRSSNPLLGVYQDLTATSAADLGGKGCVYNQNVGEMIHRTRGLKLLHEEPYAAGLFRSFVCAKAS
jgi:ubiquinone/menaquinone biosynthesis C-methylase UbiE